MCRNDRTGMDPSNRTHMVIIVSGDVFYPPGREKIHAIGAIEIALWD